jgi:hypothetical protein
MEVYVAVPGDTTQLATLQVMVDPAPTSLRDQHLMEGFELKQFHGTLRTNLSKIQRALIAQLSPEDVQKLQKLSGDCKGQIAEPWCTASKDGTFKLVQNPIDQCATYDKVFTISSAICSLYVIAAPIAAAICEAAAIYAYNDCINSYCFGPVGGYCDDPNGCENSASNRTDTGVGGTFENPN